MKKPSFSLSVLLVLLSIPLYTLSQDRPSEIPADDPWFKMGYLNVLHFGADNTGNSICTDEIQYAVETAQAYKLACYFPSGTYLIDDTINCVMPIIVKSGGNSGTDRRMPVYIVGADNPRPVIKLAPGAQGYGQGSKKPMFWLRASRTSPTSEKSNIAFNLMVRNMIFDLNGHRGAVGVRFAGAQGSAIEDVKVIATGAFAAFYNCPGQGGGCYNIEVEGGDYAWYIADDNARFINMVGIECRNQEIEVIRIVSTNRPMQITGFHFVKESGAIMSGWPSAGGGISMVDGIVEYTGASQTGNMMPAPSTNLFMENVFIKNCNQVIPNNSSTTLNPDIWNHIKEFRFTGPNGICLIDGTTESANTSNMDLENADPPDPAILTSSHTWDPLSFVSVHMRNDEDYVDVKDPVKMTGPAGPAAGDGAANDTEALQWAIDHYKKVFIPKGTYLIDTTLVLGSHTQMFGAGKTYSVIRPAQSWKSSSDKVMISTVADADATTSLSFLLLEIDAGVHQDYSRIEWKAGKNSIIRDIMIGAVWTNQTASLYHYLLKITGPTGGGRFYCFTAEYTLNRPLTNHPDYRAVLIENCHEPIRFYGYNSERIFSNTQFEIKNSSDVQIYYLKSEANANDGPAQPLSIVDSENIRLYSLAGNIKVRNERGIVETHNSNHVLAVNMKTTQALESFYNLKEVFNSQTYTIESSYNFSVFSRSQSTGIPSSVKSSLKVYPNPVNDLLFIEAPGKTGLSAFVYDLKGSLQAERLLNNERTEFSVNGLKPGVYILRITNKSGFSEFHKIVKH